MITWNVKYIDGRKVLERSELDATSYAKVETALRTRIVPVSSINLDDARALIESGFIVVIVR